MSLRLYPLLYAGLVLFSGPVAAADGDIVRDLQEGFRDSVALWYAPLQQIATWLLLSLAVISYTWSASQMVLRNADLGEFVAEFVRLVIFTGFFLFLIQGGQQLAETMIKGWIWIGGQATSTSLSMSVPEILERGFTLGGDIISAGSGLSRIAYTILALPVVILYTLIAAYAFFVMAEMYVVTAAGVVLLGFGGSQWTVDYAKKYITYTISIGVKLYVMFLVIGAGEQFIHQWAMDQEHDSFRAILAIIGVLLMMVILVKMIPDAVQGIINGASLGAATPTVGGMARAAGSAALGATVGAAGSAMAVLEASKLAGEQVGGGAQASASVSGGSSFLGIQSGRAIGGGRTEKTGAGPLPTPSSASSAAGRASGGGRMAHAGQTVKNLAKAAGETLGGKIMGDYNASHASFGGSMAQKLRAERLSMSEGGSASTGEVGQQSSDHTGGMSGSIGAAPSINEGGTPNEASQATHNRPPSKPESNSQDSSEQSYRSPAGRVNDED
ncbi:P-type conjugative transfer protein TrbL [Marinobacterium sp. AK62]|uniref:P-type conjugative transfer protein TrbL n=1 Tax=Marinobacterium alkalitolerans TaxID=1542925 RepID=A0ABS3ZAW8_9GAMM|nr:P-type conjugative transfer protein TrbL [Marinobacterium alkalitolerans]MBP0048846.1 P-type conjugative transfer protein TrbL [Marinobacterium alkalitolerans]